MHQKLVKFGNMENGVGTGPGRPKVAKAKNHIPQVRSKLLRKSLKPQFLGQ